VRAGTLARGAVFLGALAALFPLQALADAHRPELPSSLLYTPDRRLMKVVACGHGSLLADLVWVESTNYVMTGFKSGKTHLEHLYALYDVMTELDPDFIDAYVMGAVFLSSVADEAELAVKLLEKGHGRLEERAGAMAQVTSGTVHPLDKERWRLVNELAATHYVSFAGYAPTLEERYLEINLGGRMLVWGAQRYDRARYPERPEWWEEIGRRLAAGDAAHAQGSRGGWYQAAAQVWEQRLHFTEKSSPLYDLYLRRYEEVLSRQVFEKTQAEMAKGRVPVKLPDDPLGVGFFIVEGRLVAPGLDAALLERQLAHDAAAFRRRSERAPRSLEELQAFEASEKLVRSVPPFVEVSWDAAAEAPRVLATRPRSGPEPR